MRLIAAILLSTVAIAGAVLLGAVAIVLLLWGRIDTLRSD
jgi:hypothetical protein